jgi:hypothetical protein
VAALGAAQKVYIELFQINLSPGQGRVVPGIIEFNQDEVKLPAAKGALEIGSDSVDSFFLPFVP